jgi:isopenicillin N synthase-like dioxygenase
MQVKVCNLRSNDFGSDFKKSVVDTGFAVVTHHGIDHGLIKEMQQSWKLFFLAHTEYKNYYSDPDDANVGYKGMKTEKAVGAKKADLKEFYHYQPGWPVPMELAAATQRMFYQLEDLGIQILSTLDFAECCKQSDNTILRTIYYPAMNYAQEPGAVRAAAHEDINFITLLVAASAPGLQVLDLKGKWHDVPHEENSIVVNIGDSLQLASRGLYRSTTHRVVNASDSLSDRISMPMFIHPAGNTLLAEGVTAQQYLDQRLSQIYQQVKNG